MNLCGIFTVGGVKFEKKRFSECRASKARTIKGHFDGLGAGTGDQEKQDVRGTCFCREIFVGMEGPEW